MRVPLLFLVVAVSTLGAARAADMPSLREWTVEGVRRTALVYAPERAHGAATPILFAFHGHGGTAERAARGFAYHSLWPEAIVVYMQGLNTPGRLTDPQGKRSGWQAGPGDQGDRDLKFFDAVLATLTREFRVDERRLYAAGHSNGGGFTYLLWAARGEQFAAFAPSGAVLARGVALPKPRPVLHIAGENDPLVRFQWQERTMAAVRRLNRCGAGDPWAERCTRYPSPGGADVVTFLYPGGHGFPPEAARLAVRFFQEHRKP